MLADVRRLNWGYSAKLKLGKISFPVLVKAGKNSLDIVEEEGKFRVHLELVGEKDLHVTIRIEASNEVVRSSLEEGISRNLKEYAESICKFSKEKTPETPMITSFMKPFVRKVLDVRGEECPVPEIAAKKELTKMRPGEELEVLVDHPAAVDVTLPEVAKLMNCKYEMFNMGDYVSFIMLKLGDPVSNVRYVEALKTRQGIPELMKDMGFMAFLYSVFDKIVKQVPVDGLSPELLRFDGLSLVSSASIGRGWLLVALVEDEKILGVMLVMREQRLWNEDAISHLNKVKGIGNVFYLKS
ncbi:preprotein translocase subunit TatB [Metallosphaera hakonensis JCM 8857 = DSM 7519]|uniref:Preprotein translocase subunit TatB n=2 Tax=Metallosphaera hakonensis TaxID=79601 RepID=A0A2U9IWU7_9CREN|nr:preprotein translocase subunit TatB [Metallosphaera hakonensis JCM 8857 = DSM 7519]